MAEWIVQVNERIGGLVWGTPMVLLFLGTGVYFTVRSGFFQLRHAKLIGTKTFFALFHSSSATRSNDKKSLSQFQALSTALAATLGNGNIVGVATAISAGGPGAVFWMWVSAFFGMMTHFAESVLGIYFRYRNENGEWLGGPMYYLEAGLKNKKLGRFLAISFALLCMLASFGIGNMTQVNSISAAMRTSFGVSEWFCGIVLALLAGTVILGGVGRIGRVTEKLVPVMSILYIVACVTVFILNIRQVPYVFSSIFKSAFSFEAVAGAGSGLVMKRAVSMGFRRGIFSNEAGLGSSVMAHCAADVKEPVEQGMWGIFEVFADTILVCTLTAFVLLSSTADVLPLNEALQKVDTTPRYVSLDHTAGVVPLVQTGTHPKFQLGSSKGIPKTVTTVDGGEYTIYFQPPDEKDYVFTNVMVLRGQQAKEEDGSLLFTEQGKPVIASVALEELDGISLAVYAFSQRFGPLAGKVLSIAVLLFAFATVLGWSVYGTQAAEYLFGMGAKIPFQLLFVLMIVFGATQSMGLVWNISDTLNGLMALPNLIGILSLSGLVFDILKNYEQRQRGALKAPIRSAYQELIRK
ncbi:MAG: sodium:alanine symporter family protein [Clostridia bacterium]|nr:sodium:alanine symporter family protein [Clostridia bacterium]